MNAQFLQEAIRLSIENLQNPGGGPFGALIVRDGKIIGRGQNRVAATCDPTAHAEVVAIRDACARERIFTLAGCEIYTSCEPCPMCLSAIYWSHLDHIIYAATRSDADAAGFNDDKLYHEIARPIPDRSIPMINALRHEACAAFKTWQTKPDRIEY